MTRALLTIRCGDSVTAIHCPRLAGQWLDRIFHRSLGRQHDQQANTPRWSPYASSVTNSSRTPPRSTESTLPDSAPDAHQLVADILATTGSPTSNGGETDTPTSRDQRGTAIPAAAHVHGPTPSAERRVNGRLNGPGLHDRSPEGHEDRWIQPPRRLHDQSSEWFVPALCWTGCSSTRRRHRGLEDTQAGV